jgi:hypothetical protein
VATLRDLRRLVGDKTGDVLVLEASSVSASESTFTDAAHLGDRGDRAASIVNKLLYFSEGTADNLQHEAAVTDYTSSSRTLTFDPAAPQIPQEGDVAELWSVAERIGSIGAIHRLINYAIDAVKDVAGAEAYATVQTYNARTGSLDIPATWAEFGGAEYLPIGTTTYRVDIRPSHLTVQPSLRTVRIRGEGAARAHRRSVYLYGYLRCLPLVDEDDETTVNSEWIVESVAEALTLARSWASSDSAAAERRANFWSAKAALYRRAVAQGRRGLGIALPV